MAVQLLAKPEPVFGSGEALASFGAIHHSASVFLLSMGAEVFPEDEDYVNSDWTRSLESLLQYHREVNRMIRICRVSDLRMPSLQLRRSIEEALLELDPQFSKSGLRFKTTVQKMKKALGELDQWAQGQDESELDHFPQHLKLPELQLASDLVERRLEANLGLEGEEFSLLNCMDLRYHFLLTISRFFASPEPRMDVLECCRDFHHQASDITDERLQVSISRRWRACDAILESDQPCTPLKVREIVHEKLASRD